VGQGVAGFERGNDAFETAQRIERGNSLVVIDGDVLRAPHILKQAMLGATPG